MGGRQGNEGRVKGRDGHRRQTIWERVWEEQLGKGRAPARGANKRQGGRSRGGGRGRERTMRWVEEKEEEEEGRARRRSTCEDEAVISSSDSPGAERIPTVRFPREVPVAGEP